MILIRTHEQDTTYTKHLLDSVGIDPEIITLRSEPFSNDAELKKYLGDNGAFIDGLFKKKDPKVIFFQSRIISHVMLGHTIIEAAKKHDLFVDGYKVYFIHEEEQMVRETCMYNLTYQSFLSAAEYVKEECTPHEYVTTPEQVLKIIAYAKETKNFCFDFETTGLEWYKPEVKPTMLSMSVQAGYSYILPLYHDENELKEKDFLKLLKMLAVIFEDYNITKIGHNIKFDIHWVYRYCTTNIIGRLFDTLLAHQLLDENASHKLKEIIKIYFPKYAGYEEGIDYLGPLIPLGNYAANDSDLTIRLKYLFEYMLLTEMENDIASPEEREHHRDTLYLIFRNLTMYSLRAYLSAEETGADIDEELLDTSIIKLKEYIEQKDKELLSFKEVFQYENWKRETLKNEKIEKITEKISSNREKFTASYMKKLTSFTNKLATITDPVKREKQQVKITMLEGTWAAGSIQEQKYKQQIYDLKAGLVNLFEKINLNSPDQVNDLLYDWFKIPLPIDPMTKKEKRTSNKDFIKDIDHPFIETFLTRRSMSKMLKTYYKGIKKELVNGKYHMGYNLAGTVTGRVSAFIHTMPARSSWKDEHATWSIKQVKRFFIVKDRTDRLHGNVPMCLLQADYSQAELRIIANYADEPTMKELYRNGGDIHSKTGAAIVGLTDAEFQIHPDKKKYRQNAKPANFGWVYKSSAKGYQSFSKRTYGIEVTESEAYSHKDAIFGTYKMLQPWHDKQEALVRKYKYVRTAFGRKRRLPEIDSSREYKQAEAIRYAINNPIQGTGGEYAIYCAGLLEDRLPDYCKFIITIHDSVFYYLPVEHVNYASEIIKYTCEKPPLQFFNFPSFYNTAIPMKMDFECSVSNWGEMIEI